VADLVKELLPLLLREEAVRPAAAALGCEPTDLARCERLRADAVLEALLAYSRAIRRAVPSMDMALAEFGWRNGALLRLGATPGHLAWLRRAGVRGEVLAAYSARSATG
jgi:hypothetical protein